MNYREISPQRYARIGGVAYLLIILLGLFGEMFVRNSMIVSGDPVATAQRIAASPGLWRMGIAGDILMHILDVVSMLVFYILLRPVHKPLAMFALICNIIQTAVLVTNKLTLLIPLFFLEKANYLNLLQPKQAEVLSYLAIKAHGYGFGVGLIFFGVECIVVGFLIFKSGYFPKLLGILMQLAGISYIVNSFTLLIAPDIAGKLFPAILLPSFIGETSFCLWLLIKGVNLPKWNERLK